MKRFILTLLCFLCFGIAFGNEPSVVSGEYIIDDWKIYISEEGNISIKEYKGSSENVAIPDNFDGFPVVSIGQNAFQKKYVVSVTIPDSVTYIDSYAFDSCSNLKSVVIGKSVETISESAFSYCKSLEKIVIPDSVKKIESSAFYGCENLTSVDFGNSLEEIGYYAFYYCSSLTSVVIPDSVTSIGNYCFSGCAFLVEITLPTTLVSIGRYCFNSTEISKIHITTDERYHFKADEKIVDKSIWDDIKIPKSAFELIYNRAEFHGMVDNATMDDLIEGYSYNSAWQNNAEKMLNILMSEPRPDINTNIKNLFGYLFAKAIEMTFNESKKEIHSFTLSASYNPDEAFAGEISSTLSESQHQKIVCAMELGTQFYKDFENFVVCIEPDNEDFIDILTKALIIVQRIGESYTSKYMQA